MNDHIYEIEEILEDWSRDTLSSILDERMDILCRETS